MDAIKFITEKNRMCFESGGCEANCPISKVANHNEYKWCSNFINDNPQKAVKLVEEWSNTHRQLKNNEFRCLKCDGIVKRYFYIRHNDLRSFTKCENCQDSTQKYFDDIDFVSESSIEATNFLLNRNE